MGTKEHSCCRFYTGWMQLLLPSHSSCQSQELMMLHANHFKGHFPGKPQLAGWPHDLQSPVIMILSILTGQTKILCTLVFEVGRWEFLQGTFGLYCTHLTLTTIPRGSEADVFQNRYPSVAQKQTTSCSYQILSRGKSCGRIHDSH